MQWLRYKYQDQVRLGMLDNEQISPCQTNQFGQPSLDSIGSESSIALSEVEILTPTQPTKMVALWNNYKALAREKGLTAPKTPLYLIKPPNSYLACQATIQHPVGYQGDVFYEGELGIVIGKTVKDLVDLAEAEAAIEGYTCINDVTAFGLLKEEDNFDQWTRAKGFDTFGVFGPVVATDLDPATLEIITRVDGNEVQRYPASDMILPPREIVQQLSQNMTLECGDIICCGTSIGLGPMPLDCVVEVEIPGIGCLTNPYSSRASIPL